MAYRRSSKREMFAKKERLTLEAHIFKLKVKSIHVVLKSRNATFNDLHQIFHQGKFDPQQTIKANQLFENHFCSEDANMDLFQK